MTGNSHPLDQAILRATPWLIGGLVAATPLLLVPGSDDRRWDLIIHLSLLVAFSIGLTWRLGQVNAEGWFADRQWSGFIRFMAGATALVVIVTGVTALVALASSAALRFEPSLQFLQLLSALDIAWVVAGTTLATRYLWGTWAAVIAGSMMSVICVLSIALYLGEVGLNADGGWLVDGSQMLRLVLPFDVVAAIMTVSLVMLAARRSPD